MEKLSALPPQKQEQVLHYVETLQRRASKAKAKKTEADAHPWIKVALAAKLDGPADWSERFEDYLNADSLKGTPRETRR